MKSKLFCLYNIKQLPHQIIPEAGQVQEVVVGNKVTAIMAIVIHPRDNPMSGENYATIKQKGISSRLRYDLIVSDHIAFMFNVGTFPDLGLCPIDANICMRHLRHNI